MNNDLTMLVGARAIGAAIGVPGKREYELADKGALPVINLGGSIAIRRAKLAEFIESLETSAAGSAAS